MSEAIPHRLAAAAGLAEQGFLAAGQSLEQAVALLDRLSHRFAGFIAGLTGAALSDTRSDLAAAGAQILALAETRRTDATSLDALQEIVAAARRRVAALEPITHEVEILSLNARVVAGDMGLVAAEFAAFAGGIRDAAQHARSCLKEALAAIGLAEQDLLAAHAEAATFVRRHGQAMQDIPARLAGNLQSVAAQRSLAADAAVAAHQQSDAVRQQVAGQIVALQLGDIIRQRLEHVQSALRMADTQQRAVGDLLAAQIDDTCDELVREGDGIEAGLRLLAQAARAIGLLGVRVHGEARGGGFLAALETDIRQTAALFGELSAGDAANDRRMAAVLDAAAALASRLARVQSVQEDIRIMGLNATLKCGRLGAVGRPLAVVAQELRLCSGRFGASADSVLQDLDRLRPIASLLCDPSRRGKHAALAHATEDLLVPLRRLNQLEHDVALALAQLQDDAAEVGRLVEAAIGQFAVRQGLATALRQVAAELASWPDDEPSPCETFARIAAGYTMARERDVHRRFAPLPEAPVDTLADVLF